MQSAELGEPKKHYAARIKVEKFLNDNGYEILQNNQIINNISFFCEPFRSIFGRFSTKLEYVHSYDIVCKKEINYLPKKHTFIQAIEIDGWNSRHGEKASKRTRLQQQKKDMIAQGVFKICADIIKMCNRNISIDFDFIRVRQEEILKCKNDQDLKKCFIKAAEETYLWSSKETR